jgi:RecA/RadA recombinase
MMICSGTPIDTLLDGGVQTGLVTHIYGPAGSGKTTFALHASISAAVDGHNILYLDTEQTFPTSRLLQVMGKEINEEILHRIIISQPSSFQEQGNQFSELRKNGGDPWGASDLRLVVVDTIGNYYRSETSKRPRGIVFKELTERQMPDLLKAAKRYDVAVLVLNQTTSNLSCNEEFTPVGGDAISRFTKYEIRLEIDETMNCIGCATTEKTPRKLRNGKKARYAITSTGIAQLQRTGTRFSVL